MVLWKVMFGHGATLVRTKRSVWAGEADPSGGGVSWVVERHVTVLTLGPPRVWKALPS